MNTLFTEFEINGFKLKNRIVMPPLVNFHWSDDEGNITEKHILHYEKRAKGEVGMIIVEASAVNKNGRLQPDQLGIWSDSHIEGLRKIVEVCHNYGTIVLLQIHHGGLNTHPKVSEKIPGPSVDPNKPGSYSLEIDEIRMLTNDFIKAAERAIKAGFDGVELHGAHLYLLSEFATSAVNRRSDIYGVSLEGRLKFAKDIIQGIKKNTNDFITGIRMGANAPTLEDGIKIAKEYEKYGVDYLHVSHNGYSNLPEVPENFDYNWVVYSGTEIKKHVSIPVIAVNEIKTPERASYLIENNMADLVAIGRDILTDPEWAKKARTGEQINLCINCKPRCKRYESDELCPKKTF